MDSPPELLTGVAPSCLVELRRWRAADADLCFRIVSESLEHLRPWMPWAAGDYGRNDAVDYLQRCEAGWSDGSGYWVHPTSTGRGVATAASGALTDAALALPGISHVEIHYDALNLASGRVPAKLGYTHVDTREARFDLAPGDSGATEVWRITPLGRYSL